MDVQASTLHYFNMYAIRDRVDTSMLEDNPSLPDPSTVNLSKLLPSAEEHQQLYKNLQVLFGRVLVKYIPYFKEFGAALPRHIKHEHYSEMAKKSEVVSFEVL